jgi:hypothetical protein
MTAIELKLQRCREDMGSRYLCHPSRQVKRLAQPLADSAGTDIRETFRRLAQEPVIFLTERSKQ